MEREAENRPLKLYFLPFLAAGHMIPLCDIAMLFASRGQDVTVITTPSNAETLLKRKSNNHLHIHTVDIPSDSPQIENITSATNIDSAISVYTAAMLLRQPVEQFLRENPPDCIVADFMYQWVSEIANTLQIPRLAFNGFPLFAVCAMNSFSAHPELFSGSVSEPFNLPDLPHPITMHARSPEGIFRFYEALLKMEVESHGLIVNSFVEIESEYVEHYERTTGHKAWHLGPASLVHASNQQKSERGHISVVSENDCVSWLNSKQPNSVVYISFGSTCRFSDNQLYEIAAGVEASGHPFIWVVLEKLEEKGSKGWLPEGFEERMKEKGMIIRGWAPQVLILDHPAIGGFLTHCGWNSVVEGVSAGVPMMTWPVQADQFYNEKLITEVQGNGVEVGAVEWGVSGYGERKIVISREKIEKAVRRVMDGGDEAEEIRRRARQLAVKAKEAVREGGSSHRNLRELIRDLKLLRDSRSAN
uniref:Glycosyltransferase n=1 Tax=Astragalus mongholicus TaxID=119829 RepID=A0A977WM43_ASTMO|nr:O-glycosyltransferase [Astragalus mongholicus]